LSGAARYLDLQEQELEESSVMAQDGSTADLLTYRLSQVLLGLKLRKIVIHDKFQLCDVL
jgi:hypothetical protein